MPNIFTYDNYRKFLADYYDEKKSETPSFSYQNFSKKAGFASKSFVFNVIQGKKNLSSSSIIGISEAMGLNKTESLYFEKLIYFNQASSFKERSFFFEQLNAITVNNKEAINIRKIRQDQYDYYSKWYNATIRSIIDLYPFKNDYNWLARIVYPAITPIQAKKSVQLLERLELIKKDKSGRYRVTSKLLSTGKEVTDIGVQQFHVENMKLAENAIKSLPKNKRNISGLTLGISEKSYKEISDIIFESQDRILKIAELDKEANKVYQLNFHLFPVSKSS